jgi:hypothetical protein
VASQLPEKGPPAPPAKPVAPVLATGKARQVVVSGDAVRYLGKHLQNYLPELAALELVPKILAAVEADQLVVVLRDKAAGAQRVEIVEGANYSDRDAVRSAAAAQDDELLEIVNQNLVSLGLVTLE